MHLAWERNTRRQPQLGLEQIDTLLRPQVPLLQSTTPEIKLNFADKPGDLASNPLMVDLDDDCGYKGGVNIIYPDTEYVPGDTSTEFDLDSESRMSLVVMNLKGILRST